jgi:hypothetical protein
MPIDLPFSNVRMRRTGSSEARRPGCGKTTVLAAIAIIFYLCGFDILLVGPSNASVDALTKKFKELGPDFNYVRVRRGEVEKRSRTTANPRATDHRTWITNLKIDEDTTAYPIYLFHQMPPRDEHGERLVTFRQHADYELPSQGLLAMHARYCRDLPCLRSG